MSEHIRCSYVDALYKSTYTSIYLALLHVCDCTCSGGGVLCCSRIFEILPVRIKDWQSSPCIADEKSRAALERIRHQQLLAREKLLALDRRRHDLEALIERAKRLTVQQEVDVSRRHLCMINMCTNRLYWQYLHCAVFAMCGPGAKGR